MLIPLGILDFPTAAGSYDLIQSEILTSSQASVTFDVTGLGSTYQHLQIRYVVRSSIADVVDELYVYLNGDSSSSYSNHYLRANGSTVTSGAQANATKVYDWGNTITGSTAPSNSFGVGVMDILDPFETKYTTIRTFGAAPYAASAGYIALNSSSWRNTAAITSIEFDLPASSFVSGSRFSIYGLRSS